MSQAVPLRSIQILRAVAACLVVFGHALHEIAEISARTGRPPLNVNVIDWGIGVDIFFVISGFIMIYTTAELFGQPGGHARVSDAADHPHRAALLAHDGGADSDLSARA